MSLTPFKEMTRWMHCGQSGLVLTSVEPEDFVTELTATALRSQQQEMRADRIDLFLFDDVDGLVNAMGVPVMDEEEKPKNDNAALLRGGSAQKPIAKKLNVYEVLGMALGSARNIVARINEDEKYANEIGMATFFIRNFDHRLFPHGAGGPPDPQLLELTQKLLRIGPQARVFLIMQTATGFELPVELIEHCQFIDHGLPDTDERAASVHSNFGLPLTPALAQATSGLSRGKTIQFVSRALADKGTPIDAGIVFKHKASHLSRASKLQVWSPEFDQTCKLWPTPEAGLGDAIDVQLLQQETQADGAIRVKIGFIQDKVQQEKWLEVMPVDTFNALYRPDRNFYSFKSIVGLEGLKKFLKNGVRPDVPLRSKLKHVLMLGVPGTGKTMTQQCCSGEFGMPLSSMSAASLYSKWLGETDKILDRMLSTVSMIGGILAIDEFQRFLPQGGSNGEAGGVENRMLGTLLTWFNDQRSNLVLSAANNISKLPDEVTRSGRCDAIIFVGFPGDEAKEAAWKMYLKRHELDKDQARPDAEFWTPADISSCCRLAELQRTSIVEASKWVVPSYEKSREQMDSLMEWAESSGCICAESGERFRTAKTGGAVAAASTPSSTRRRQVRTTKGDDSKQ